MPQEKITLAEAFRKVTEPWQPRVVAELNGQVVKVVRLRGEFIWHQHDQADELFFVMSGRLRLELRSGPVTLSAGELFVVPAGVEHRPVAEPECEVLLFEPRGVRNTGDVVHADLTAATDIPL
jgi:mannose-6-phosphate isomerase-like protein (cupin superfamily)